MKSLALILFLILPLTAAEPLAPPLPDSSPIEEFRKLIQMNDADRTANLATRPAGKRGVLEEKLTEYAALPEGERKSRLNALELRWYLRTLIDYPVSRRSETIAKAPEELRKVLQERLGVWDQMSTNTQKRILEDEVVDYLTTPAFPPKPTVDFGDNHLEAFFKLPAEKQQKALETIRPQQRIEVNKAVTAIRQLSPNKRAETMAAFGKFAKMDKSEKKLFLDKVDRWKKMTPQAQDAWRNISTGLPDLPPLPEGFQPPMPPLSQ